jgi:hypothetical protein
MEAQVAKVQKEFDNAIKKKQMLRNLCKDLIEKNYELYLKHEIMLEEERKQRQSLATSFGAQMQDV